jgi:hypothetical protein
MKCSSYVTWRANVIVIVRVNEEIFGSYFKLSLWNLTAGNEKITKNLHGDSLPCA